MKKVLSLLLTVIMVVSMMVITAYSEETPYMVSMEAITVAEGVSTSFTAIKDSLTHSKFYFETTNGGKFNILDSRIGVDGDVEIMVLSATSFGEYTQPFLPEDKFKQYNDEIRAYLGAIEQGKEVTDKNGSKFQLDAGIAEYIVHDSTRLMNYDEFNKYRERFSFSLKNANNINMGKWMINNVTYDNGKIKNIVVLGYVGKTNYFGTTSNYSPDEADSFSHVRPYFWVKADYFKKHNIDIINAGYEVKEAIENNCTRAELEALGYSVEELSALYNRPVLSPVTNRVDNAVGTSVAPDEGVDVNNARFTTINGNMFYILDTKTNWNGGKDYMIFPSISYGAVNGNFALYITPYTQRLEDGEIIEGIADGANVDDSDAIKTTYQVDPSIQPYIVKGLTASLTFDQVIKYKNKLNYATSYSGNEGLWYLSEYSGGSTLKIYSNSGKVVVSPVAANVRPYFWISEDYFRDNKIVIDKNTGDDVLKMLETEYTPEELSTIGYSVAELARIKNGNVVSALETDEANIIANVAEICNNGKYRLYLAEFEGECLVKCKVSDVITVTDGLLKTTIQDTKPEIPGNYRARLFIWGELMSPITTGIALNYSVAE